jgi:hypothetical protein
MQQRTLLVVIFTHTGIAAFCLCSWSGAIGKTLVQSNGCMDLLSSFSIISALISLLRLVQHRFAVSDLHCKEVKLRISHAFILLFWFHV